MLAKAAEVKRGKVTKTKSSLDRFQAQPIWDISDKSLAVGKQWPSSGNFGRARGLTLFHLSLIMAHRIVSIL